jgi:hypothetical protein
MLGCELLDYFFDIVALVYHHVVHLPLGYEHLHLEDDLPVLLLLGPLCIVGLHLVPGRLARGGDGICVAALQRILD